MPYVNIKVTRDGVSKRQKAQIVAEVTDTLVRVLGKKPEHTHVVIDEVQTDNWGFAGQLTTEWRAKAQRGAGAVKKPGVRGGERGATGPRRRSSNRG
jgi:4-oxalocrotonate tautomerase